MCRPTDRWSRHPSATSAAVRKCGCCPWRRCSRAGQRLATFDFPGGVPNGFTFSEDGRHLFGGAYLTGVSNIFVRIATKKLDAVSNTNTGFFRPVHLGGDDLIMFRFTGDGFRPARMTSDAARRHCANHFLWRARGRSASGAEELGVGSPRSFRPTMPKQEGVYWRSGGEARILLSDRPGYRRPRPSGYARISRIPCSSSGVGLGALLAGHGSPTTSSAFISTPWYQRYDWTLRASSNHADFYDLFGPTEVSRKGQSVTWDYYRTLVC